MTLSIEDEKSIFNFLSQQNCCSRCCFRFIGLRALDCYRDPIGYAIKFNYINKNGSFDEKLCVACLGILQDKAQDAAIKKIENEVEQQNYDCKTFTCALTVPVSVRLRERLLHTRCAIELGLSEGILCTFKSKLTNMKDVWKWVIIPKLESALKMHCESSIPSDFLIEIFLVYKYDEEECKALLDLYKDTSTVGKQKRNSYDRKFSRKNMETLMAEITDEQFTRCFKALSLEANESIHVENVTCSHTSIFIGGRYNKLSRELSQTPWFINGEKKMETSVQDILCNPIAQAVRAQSIKFLSSGREDVDVRNIYSGRPFAVELVNPRMTKITKELLFDLVDEVNQSSKQVQITSQLKVLSQLDLKKLKEGENVKTKFYRALCVCRDAQKTTPCLEILNKLKSVKIIQKTPVRVLHRRPLTPRSRFIYEMRARWAKASELNKLLHTAGEDANSFFVLDFKTQAGTYVKEFVHGDFGRTKPSLCDLLKAEVDIVALDVTGINLNWP